MDKKSTILSKSLPNWDGPYVIEKFFFFRNVYVIREVNTESYIGSINGK